MNKIHIKVNQYFLLYNYVVILVHYIGIKSINKPSHIAKNAIFNFDINIISSY